MDGAVDAEAPPEPIVELLFATVFPEGFADAGNASDDPIAGAFDEAAGGAALPF